VWYGVQCGMAYTLAYARWCVTRGVARLVWAGHRTTRLLYRPLPWQLYEWCGWIRQAVFWALRFMGWRAAPAKAPDDPVPAGIYGPDLCSLIGQCGPRDVVLLSAAEIADIERLFGLIAKLQLEKPLPTTLHVRLAAEERAQGDTADVTTLGARLKSGSP